jgi:small subunit ribosomal protein S8
MPNVTDPIADLLTRVRNGLQADHEFVEMQASKLRIEVARILAAQGYIEDYSTDADSVGQVLRIRLKYTGGRQPVITGLQRVSRPGRRTYVKAAEIPKVLGGMGTTILSTSSGVMTGHEARAAGVGGEVVAYVW